MIIVFRGEVATASQIKSNLNLFTNMHPVSLLSILIGVYLPHFYCYLFIYPPPHTFVTMNFEGTSLQPGLLWCTRGRQSCRWGPQGFGTPRFIRACWSLVHFRPCLCHAFAPFSRHTNRKALIRWDPVSFLRLQRCDRISPWRLFDQRRCCSSSD